MKKGWELKKLGEISEYFNGLTYSPKNVSEKGMVVLRSSNVQNDELDFSDIVRVNLSVKEKLTVKNGDILMCSRNGSKRLVGKTASINNLNEAMTFGTFMMIIRSQYNPYLSWFFKSTEFRKQISGGENTMINQITRYMLDDVEVPFPPKNEQKKIVAILDEAFIAIANAKLNAQKNLKNAQDFFESYLQNVFYGEGNEWEKKKLSTVCELIMGQSPAGETYNSDGIGIPLINGPVEFGKEPFSKTIKSKFTTDPTKYCKKGDLILCVRGSTTGRINIAGFDACIGRGVAAIRYKENQKWLNYFFLFSRRMIYDLGTGATFPNVSGEILKNLKIPIPSLIIQKQIIEKLDVLSTETKKLESIYQQKIEDLEELKKSVLQKAFNGELNTSKIPD
jgi:type I restriction enzyme S subunit